MTFKERAARNQERRNTITTGRTQIKMAELVGSLDVCTITDFATGINKEGKAYMICTCKELPARYFFASSVLMNDLCDFFRNDCDGNVDKARQQCLRDGGWPYKVSIGTSKDGRTYYSWQTIIVDSDAEF